MSVSQPNESTAGKTLWIRKSGRPDRPDRPEIVFIIYLKN